MRWLLLPPILLLTSGLWAATLQTADGLVLALDSQGQLAGMRIGDSKLPVRVGGGFWVADAAAARPPELLVNGGFEQPGGEGQPCAGWQTVEYADLPGCRWSVDEASGRPGRVARLEQPLTTPQRPAVPLTLAERVPVRPGTTYRLDAWVRWEGATPAQNPGVYLVFHGAAKASRQTGLYMGEAMARREWSRYSQVFTAGPGETAATVYSNLYGARGTVWLDDISLTEEGRCPAEGFRHALRGKVASHQGVLSQEQTFAAAGLKLSATYASSGPYLSVSGRVEDTTGQDRAVEVTWEAPLQAEGWVWADDILQRRVIGGAEVFRNTWACPAGPGYNQTYPFSSLAHGPTGLALGVPLAQGPRVYSLEYDNAAQRLRVRFHLGLSRRVQKLPGKGWFSFLIYRHDGTWGLRSAADRYYRFFPEDFAKRVPHEGYLGYAHLETSDGQRGPAALYDLPAPGDFGRGFNWLWHQHTAYSALRYETAQRGHPDDATVRRLLQEWETAQGPETPYAWNLGTFDLLGQKRRMTWEEPAWSLRRRLYEDAAGKITWVGDSRYEGAGGGLEPGWLLNFQVSEDPDLSPAVQDSLRRALDQWERDYPDRDPYTWCISADGTGFTGRQLDFRPEHIASSEAPLTYDRETRQVAVADVTWEWNSRVLGPLSRERKFLLHRNFVCGTPFVGANLPFVDIGLIECEYGRYGMTEECDRYVRTVGHQKVFRYWFYPAVGAGRDESIRAMFHRGLVYAIYPHLVPGAEQYRDLYLRFVPVVERLSAAGWQPITGATANDPDLRLERYGAVAQGNLCLAFRNVASQPRRAKIFLQPRLGLPAKAGAMVVRDLLTGETVAPLVEQGQALLPVSLGPGEATAYSVLPRGPQLAADLKQAADLLRQAAPLNMTEETTYSSNRPGQFIADGQPAQARPERVLSDGWTAYQGLIWQPGEPVEITFDLNSPQRLQALRVSYGRGQAYGIPAGVVEGRDREGNWQPLGELAAITAAAVEPRLRVAIKAPGEYQFVRLRWSELTQALWLQEIEFTGREAALIRAADRFALLAANPRGEDFGLVSQLALALRVRRMLGHDRTLQERALQVLSDFISLGSGVTAQLQLPEPFLSGVSTPAWVMVDNRGAHPLREGAVKLRLPPGWRAAPSKFDLEVPAGQSVKLPLTLIAPAGPAAVSLLVTGVVNGQPLFLNRHRPTDNQAPVVARWQTPLLPATPGPRELALVLESRAAETLLARVECGLPEGWPPAPPGEVRLAPRGRTPVTLRCEVPPSAVAGRINVAVRLSHGEAVTTQPLSLLLTTAQAICRRAPEAPRLDGMVGTEEWSAATALAGLSRGDGTAPSQATAARLLWDDQRLYLALTCAEDRMAQLRAEVTGRDAPVWQGDAVGVMLNCGGVAYKLEVGPTGAFFDSREGAADWNGAWEVAVRRGGQEWMVEASLPWTEVGWLPRAGLCFGLNVCRQQKPRGEVSLWVPGGFNDGWNVGAVTLAE